MTGHPPSATGAVFSISKLPEDEKEKTQVTVSTVEGVESNESSRAPSIRDAEKAEGSILDDEKALASYIVPALEKGRKNALLKKPSLWIRFKVWYNPYRMVRRMESFSSSNAANVNRGNYRCSRSRLRST